MLVYLYGYSLFDTTIRKIMYRMGGKIAWTNTFCEFLYGRNGYT